MNSPPGNDPACPVATIHVVDEEALGRLADRIAAVLPPRAFLALSGDLGAGKTTLVKRLAAAVGVDPAEVVSPTFGLIHVHPVPAAGGNRPERIVHADLYRLTGVDELWETGWDEAVAGEAWVCVEWPERIAAALPAERIDVVIAIDSPTARTLTLTGGGGSAAACITALAAR